MDKNGEEIINPQGHILQNPDVMMMLVALDQQISINTGLRSNEFTIEVTGGDRYRGADGKIYSKTTNKIVGTSSEKSPHLVEEGARAVDIVIRKGNIKYSDIRKAAEKLGILPGNIVGPDKYPNDPHIHINLRKGYGIKEWFVEKLRPFFFGEEENIVESEVQER